jgi:hypothetical protein
MRAAVIEQAKLTRYKARVFESVLGYDLANAVDLISAIRTGIMSHEEEYMGETAHGFLGRVDILIVGPGGTASVRTGWIHEESTDVPRLTTAYVLGG